MATTVRLDPLVYDYIIKKIRNEVSPFTADDIEALEQNQRNREILIIQHRQFTPFAGGMSMNNLQKKLTSIDFNAVAKINNKQYYNPTFMALIASFAQAVYYSPSPDNSRI